MSVINYAVREVMHRLPAQILEKVFGKAPGLSCTFNPTTIEEQIRYIILYGRVLTDMNIVGGNERFIPVISGQQLHSDDLGTSYHYDEQQLHNLEIISVHYYMENVPPQGELYNMGGVTNSTKNDSGGGKCDFDNMNKRFETLIKNQKMALQGYTGNVRVRMVAKNTILATNNLVQSGYFKVTLSNDPELSMIQPRSWRVFAKLVELAVKAYIYKENVIQLEQVEIYQGVELGGVKAYIAELADSEELYQEQLDKYMKVAFMQDRPAYARFIRGQINPFI